MLRIAAIAATIVAVAACFVGVAGWFAPDRLTPARMIAAFQQVNGPHPGFRRNHAKGVCISGYFDSDGQGARLSAAAVFRPGRVPVIGRLALAGGHPFMADMPTAVRSMALSFRPPDGEEWRTAMNDIPVFTVRDARGFYEQLLAARPDPATGKPDPARMAAFLARHPETRRALQLIRATPFSSGFANASYHSLDAFRFVDADGVATPVRWSMAAVEAFEPDTPDPSVTADGNYLFDALIARLHRGPLQWHLLLTVGQPGDPTDDATMPWPRSRPQIDAGTLVIDHAEAEAPGNCRDINFDPLVLPAGIEPSDDPLLSARSAAYARSFTLRAGEGKPPSAVRVPAAGRGA